MIRFKNTYLSDNNTQWEIEIYDTLYLNANLYTVFSGDPGGFKLSYKGVTERLDPVFGSDCIVSFNVENTLHEAFLTDINTAQEDLQLRF